MKSSPDNIPLVQPLIELLGSVEKFGSDFDRPGDAEHLNETLANVRNLKDRTLSSVRRVTELMEYMEAAGLTPGGASFALSFLMELAEDMSVIELRITDRMLAKAA